MAALAELQALQDLQVNASIRRERVFRDRSNPFDVYDDLDFWMRYRFSKPSVIRIADLVRTNIQHRTNRSKPFAAEIQVLIALRFYATGSFQRIVGDATSSASSSSVCRIVKNVSAALARHCDAVIRQPVGQEQLRTIEEFNALGRIPSVVGCLDCTHVEIQNPDRGDTLRFVNRKGRYSINVQVVCDATLRMTNLVARWPGSTHDARILFNSAMYDEFANGRRQGIILADGGYMSETWLLTPVPNPRTVAERRYNTGHARMRVTVERLFGIWKRRFPCLQKLRLKLSRCLSVIVAAGVLHNLAIQYKDDMVEVAEPEIDDNQPLFPVMTRQNVAGEVTRRRIIERYFT